MDLYPSGQDDSVSLNAAIRTLTQAGGGTLRLASGRYRLPSALVFATQANQTPIYVQILGSKDTTLVWEGPADGAVFDLQHCQVPTLRDLRIEAAAGHRFRYGVFFRRVHTAQQGVSDQPPPTSLVLSGVTITPGAGAFTIGLRLNHASQDSTVDQNVDHALVEDLHIEGATDEPDLLASGIVVDGSQVQGNLFLGITVHRCGIGLLLRDGQCQLWGGRFEENRSPAHPTGGGDFVFRTGYRGGHLIQGVHSRGSYRFFSNWMEGPPENDLQHDQAVAVAVLGCQIDSLHPDNSTGDALYLRGAGGPLALAACSLGPGLHVRLGEYTQGAVVASNCQFAGPPPVLRINPLPPQQAGFAPQGIQTTQAPDPVLRLPRSRMARPPVPTRLVDLVARGARPGDPTFDHGPLIAALATEIAQAGGGTLSFPPGLYFVQTPIRLTELRGLALQGVGGRQGALDVAPGFTIGSGLVWTGAPTETMLHLHRCGAIVLESLGFSPWARPGEGSPTQVDTFVRVTEARGPIWLEELGAGWRGGVQEAAGAGAMHTFLAVEDSSAPVTVRRTTVRNASQQAILVRSATDVELQLFIAGPCQRAVKLDRGGLRWYGGGANGAGQYPDPVLVDLANPTDWIVLAGRECQDDQPCRALRLQGPGTVTFQGDHCLLPAPAGDFIDAPDGTLHFFGAGLGVPDATSPLLIRARRVAALGVLYPLGRPWQAADLLDLASRAEHAGKPWPNNVQSQAPLQDLRSQDAPSLPSPAPPVPRRPGPPPPSLPRRPALPKPPEDFRQPERPASPSLPRRPVPSSPPLSAPVVQPRPSPVGLVAALALGTASLWLLARRLRATPEQAPFDQVRKAYKQAARAVHPDLHGGSDAAMKDLNASWDRLKRGDQRRP